jgi:RNA polymerase sigma-70 factor (ECF subfamily)
MSSRAGGGSEAGDEALAAAANAGDRGALEVLLARHLDRVHAICRRVTGHPEDALDATQEALIAVTRGLHRYDGRSLFTTWLYRVATNAALDELRRRKRRPDPSAGRGRARRRSSRRWPPASTSTPPWPG